MKVNYCTHCGTLRKNQANYCHICGVPMGEADGGTGTEYAYHYEYTARMPVRKSLPGSCILAYLPMLFWLPLMTDHDDPIHRKCANQGLWLTITMFVSYLTLLLAGTLVLQLNLINFDWMYQTLIVNWASTNLLLKLPIALVGQAVLVFVLFAPINCICAVFHGMGSDKPYQIPLLGRFQLIRTEL